MRGTLGLEDGDGVMVGVVRWDVEGGVGVRSGGGAVLGKEGGNRGGGARWIFVVVSGL